MESQRQLAVVTGASSGIGFELARQFARNGFDVVMCAETDALTDAAAAVTGEAGAATVTVQADLATFEGVEQLVSEVEALGRPVDAAALNAGVGNGGRFVEIPLADEMRLIALNVASTVHLAKRLVPAMVQRGEGRLLFTSSIAATMPGPYYATYAASKSFVQSFAEALRHELEDTGVTVTALMPGPTDTDFFERGGMQDTPVDSMHKDDPADVAEDGFKALMKGQDHVVAGSIRNKVQAAGSGMLPDKAKAAMHAGMTKPQN
ncbi:SDR family NAD(P)-dependent oxidoreductase [Nakamurella endophytica]|uniref:Oxidoreductase n=1 Tax=Nakamurella endophytica TaxID=1748367 RepID=A0A917SZE0_9ACTN|nr:SDR family NAD(P)-dependent oxidoreductase [Nakamurella endophytica]GGM04855.1 oxidoreductase [Nakamurella endophytica]